MTKLGIIGAMEEEVETLLVKMEDKSASKRAGSTFYEGKLSGLDVVVVQCGIGKVNAALCVQILCDCFGVTHVVNTGIAGSLSADLDIGDLVISRDAMYHDFDCVHFGYDFGKASHAFFYLIEILRAKSIGTSHDKKRSMCVSQRFYDIIR